MSNDVETLIAFDYGAKRIGVAVGQTLSKTAEPLAVIKQKQSRINWAEIDKLIREWQPQRLIVGFPNTDDGGAIPIHKSIEHFAQQLEKRFQLPIEYCDERLSSYEASQQAHNRAHEIDAIAAQIILQTWMNTQRA